MPDDRLAAELAAIRGQNAGRIESKGGNAT
jgi:hypothetical protein